MSKNLGFSPASSSLHLFFKIINFREPVTLDFLDAELEDEYKEEVSYAPKGRGSLVHPDQQLMFHRQKQP